MGVPKFARFICERYPCILEVLNEYQIPEFDNLYLDMNGIIHCCSHPNDADAHFRITEETIFKNIFHYVEILFRTIKPQKLFFMAVDGVAPRAKINQQRSRRFRSAKEAEVAEAKARAKGDKISDEPRFDSNCITPGTEFMARLTEQLNYFVTYKVSTDKLWQKCKIILSGPQVPGEGEHKIMDYIRYMKAQPDHDPNTRHCLYGLDADLIMLSLCTHEPHFTVLREEVKYGKKQKKISVPENVKFCLLHISLLREYMRHEFEPIKDSLSFPFDLEKIIDDWIIMGFLVGNDFIPHLPNLHIANGALPILYKAYFEILPDLGGYMNEAGILNLERFEKFMEKLSSIDTETFTAHQADLRFFEAKTGKRINDQEKNRQYSTETDQFASPRKTLNKGLEALIKSTDEMLLGHSDEEGDLMNSDSDTEVYNLEFVQHKHDYYKTKFDYDCVDESVMKGQAEVYVTAIQWNLHYYYNGCCSWSWYYPYHYAPFISDIKGFRNMKISFQLDKPFLPFQQLLAVLPAGSRSLLPEAYQGLLTEEQSPIIDYYPEEFLTDLNEKKQDWEAIVLIPFINEKRLIDAMHPHNSELTADERKRNEHGPMFVITHVEENLGSFKAPAYFPSIESHAKIVTVERNEIEVPQEKLVKGLCPGMNLNIYFQGFPTLQYIEHTAKLDKCKLKVFEQTSRGENMIITISPKPLTTPLEDLAKEILGKPIYVRWPHLLEAYVYGVSNEKQKITIINSEKRYSVENSKTEELRGQALSQWTSEAAEVVSNYKNRFGIVVGNVDTLIHARPINGYRYVRTSQGLMTLKKQWSTNSVSYAYQTIVQDIEVGASSLSSVKELEKVFTPKSICFMLGHPHYGAIGEVHDSGMNKKTGRVKVAMVVTAEPHFNKLKAEDQDARMHYMHGSIAAQRLGISSYLLSRITGSIFVLPRSSENCERRQHNIGLNLKFTKRNEELPGYTKKSNGQWLYSSKSIGLIRSFMESFPYLFEKLAQSVNNDIFNEDDLFPKEGDGLSRAVAWLSEQPFRNIESRNCDWDGLDPDVIEKIEKTVDQFLDQNDDGEKTLMMQVKSHLLYMPCLSSGNVPPDPSATHFLFDRIISVKESSSVPLGYKGTIINVLGPNGDPNNAYDILFDKPFISGISFSGSVTNRRYKLLAAEFINISHGIRAEQGITGVVQSPMKLSWRKPAPPAQNNSQTKTSAFASFNKNGSFYPSFSKDKQFPVQPEQQKQPQDKVMDNKDKKKQRNNVIPSSLPRKSEMESGKIFPQKNPSGAVVGQKTDVQVPPAPVPFTKPQKNQPNGTTEFQMLWNELHKPPVSGIKQKPAFPPMRPPQVSSSALAESHARQVNRVENMSYCARMLSHFQLLGVGLPRYFYTSQNNLVRAQIVLPDMRTFYSDLCANHELAAENAATKVFNELNLEHAPNPKKYFTVNMSPPDTWLNIQPPVNVQPITSPRIFPDAPKPIVTSPPNWNPRMPQMPLGFTQIVAPNILPVRPTGAVNNKPDKQSTPFVPLQAQKKSRNRNQKDVKQLSVQNTREAPPVSSPPPPKPQKAKPKENPRDERTIKENDQVKTKDNPAPLQRQHKTQRQRRSRIAANFGSTSATIGDDVK